MKRILSALVGIPLVIVVVFYTDPRAFLGIVLAVALLSLREYLRLCQVGMVLAVATMAAGFITVGAVYIGAEAALPGVGLLLVLLASLWKVDDPVGRFRSLGEAVLGLTYITYSFTCLYLLRELPQGAYWLMLVLVIVWSGDTLAYYGGSRFGKKLLSVLLSPNKTWGGAAWGMAGSVAGGLALAGLYRGAIPLERVVTLSFAVGLAGQLGDLLQSLWKRAKGTKDSGHLIPGHGGILDRIDSLLLGLPVGYHLIRSWGL